LSKFYELKKKGQNQEEINFFEKEDDYGNVEYKLKLANPSIERVEHLTTQMKFRLEVS
jgi:GTPase